MMTPLDPAGDTQSLPMPGLEPDNLLAFWRCSDFFTRSKPHGPIGSRASPEGSAVGGTVTPRRFSGADRDRAGGE